MGTARGINNGFGGTIYLLRNSGTISAIGSAQAGYYGSYNAVGIYNDGQYYGGNIGLLINEQDG